MIEQKDLNAFMKQGNDAFLAGKPEEPPFPASSEENSLWRRGYWNARFMSSLEKR